MIHRTVHSFQVDQNCFLPLGTLAKTLYAFVISSMRATLPDDHIIFYFISGRH
jgi:hypothetical protein